ncbi:type II/III secretion system protein [Legionella sp. PC997]|uniref:type II/III secretion system protein n=1 Tax=Legionella sp. PC997 TaxID=2755562 RepID=UPI0015F867E0|nr:type II/III secretion system protein [Legionella sp. PC997]QMT61245.1 type II/III secretion system protein [Legionella sp. PC997]
MKRFWLIGLLLLAHSVCSETITKVIELHYVPAQKVIQLVQPMLQTGEKISGSDQTLVVQVSPQTLTQIRTILHQIDVPPVTFNISIYQGDPNWLSAQNENSVTYSTKSPAEVKRTQSVKVMNGESAFVSTDQEVPIVTAVGAGFFTGIEYQQHQIKNGLLVQPIMRGSQVELKLRRVREQQNPAGGQQFDDQNIDTTLMVPLNKWVSLGSPEGTKDTDSSSVSYTAGRPFSQHATLYVKVSVADNL